MPSLGSLLRKSPRSSDARKLQHNGDVTTTPIKGEGIDGSNGSHLGVASTAPEPIPAPAARPDAYGLTNAGASFSTSQSNTSSISASNNGASISAAGPSSPRERRFSKRDILHDFLSRSIRGSSSRSGSTSDSSTASASTLTGLTPQRGNSESGSPAKLVKQRSTATSSSSPPLSTDTPLSPKSPVNSNKPLPSPPPPGSEQATGPPPKPVLKLERIMAPLTEEDIEALFSGAPQFFARSEGHFTGAPHPSVAFPWDEELEIRDLTDHAQIEDQAWNYLTAWPHITRDVHRGPSAAVSKKVAEKRRAHFYPRCRERPNMLSMQGLEKGTMGYQAILELGVADALQEEQFGFDSLGTKAHVIVEARQDLLLSKDGLRHLEENKILDQLIKNGQRYSEKHLRNRTMTNELYKELFLLILHPPSRVLDHSDPYSLSVQIKALLKVLATPNVWVDFSHVEWRIRLGQILWGNPAEDDVEDGASIKDADTMVDVQEERYWLLLQIMLACELLIRLDAITEGDELGIESIKPAEVHRFEKDANRSVKWSLHLARAWLENIEVTKSKPPELGQQDKPQKGLLALLTKRLSLTNDHGTFPHSNHHHSNKEHHVYAMKGVHWQRQVDGLTHFARKLRWPDIETYAGTISENCRAVTEGTPLNTPLATPLTTDTDTRRSSYFGGTASLTRKPSRRRKLGAALHPSGWLSKSYISGLMLPGEGLYHFLMSTLLENDAEAMRRLGPMANLCGGFVYSGKSFWSTACVVGRVLAAGKGSAECMGWISSDITPQGLGDGWLNIEVEEIPEDTKHVGKQARLWGKTALERDSSVLGSADPSSVLPADFIIPFENKYSEQPPTVSVELNALNLFAPVDSVHTTPTEEAFTPFTDATAPPDIHSYPAAVSFGVSLDEGAEQQYTFALSSDVYFVTAHPCVPSHHVRILKSPSSPTVQQIDVSDSGISGKPSSTVNVTGHPLHKNYTYTSLHLSELLAKKNFSLEDLLSNYSSTTPIPSLTPTTTVKSPKVLVVDCITGFLPQPQAHEIPLSPVSSRTSTGLSNASSEGIGEKSGTEHNMHSESRARQFGSDMEILVRAFCAEKGWNAVISRRRRGCLACAIREAGALGWKVVIRVE